MTSSPVAKPVTLAPAAATTPARSLPCPDGNVAGHLECSRPSRILASPGLIPAALTWTSTWPGPGTGVGTSTTLRTSISPYSSNRTAFTSLPPFSQDASTSRPPWVCPLAPEELTLFECQYHRLGFRAWPNAGIASEYLRWPPTHRRNGPPCRWRPAAPGRRPEPPPEPTRCGGNAGAAPPRRTAPWSTCPARRTGARAPAGSSRASTCWPCCCSGPKVRCRRTRRRRGLGPECGGGGGRRAAGGDRAPHPAGRRYPRGGRAAAAAAGHRPVPDRLQPPPGRRAGRRAADQGPLAGAGPARPRGGPDPDPPDLAARPQDRAGRAAAQLRGGGPGARRLAGRRHRRRRGPGVLPRRGPAAR